MRAAPAAPVSGTANSATAAAPPPEGSAAKDLGRARNTLRPGLVALVFIGGATEDRAGADERIALDGQIDHVGDGRNIELHRKASGDVATVVARAEQDGVGTVASLDRSSNGGRHGDTLQRATEVAGGMNRGGAVFTELSSDGISIAAAVNGFDGVGQLAGLGQQFEGNAGDFSVGRLRVHPDLGQCHLRSSYRTLR